MVVHLSSHFFGARPPAISFGSSETTLSVPENEVIGTAVGTVLATGDTGIEYSIAYGDSAALAVNLTSGELTTQLVFDREVPCLSPPFLTSLTCFPFGSAACLLMFHCSWGFCVCSFAYSWVYPVVLISSNSV